MKPENKIVTSEEAYQDLANAIVAQAAEDYRECLKVLKKHPKDHPTKREKWEIEEFFRSVWFRLLTQVDPEYILERLRKEVLNGGCGT